MKLTAQLSLGFGLVLSLALVLGGFASRAMQSSANHAEALSGKDLASIEHYLGLEGDLILSCLGVRTYGYTARAADREFGERYMESARRQLGALRTLAETNRSAELAQRADALARQLDDFARLSLRTVEITDAMSADKAALNRLGAQLAATLEALNSGLLSAPESSRPPVAALLAFNSQCYGLRFSAWQGIANRAVANIDQAKAAGTALLALAARYREAAPEDTRPLWAAFQPILADYVATLDRFGENWRTFDTSNNERFAVVERTLALIIEDSGRTLDGMAQLGESTAAVLKTTAQRLSLGLGLAVLIGVGVTWFLTRSLTSAIHACVAAVQRLAAGDLTARVGLKRSDELGTLAAATDACIESLRKLVGDLNRSAAALQQSARTLGETATSQAAAAEETTVQAGAVASAGEQLSANARSMSASAAQITQSTTTVASAMEEMSSSIQEVARNCAQESEIARQADTQTRQTRDLMAKLDDSARQIGKVVELINRIAEQTNLLALNATIEAASAGEAGRGFAVVANEVKELARQSASATEDIRRQIALIQDNTGSSIKSLDQVAQVIAQVSHISSSIAAAVEEQSATTSEIVGTIHQVASASSSLSSNVQQTADGAAEVARNISGVSQAASDGAQGAAHVNSSASELNRLSAELGSLVARFNLGGNAARAVTGDGRGA